MKPLWLWTAICLLAVPALPADTPLTPLLKRVEERYDKAKTLQVVFTEVYTPPGKMQRSESGNLLLRKPGRMRWDYTRPLRSEMKNLPFLLGKLNFDKEFRKFQSKREGPGTRGNSHG